MIQLYARAIGRDGNTLKLAPLDETLKTDRPVELKEITVETETGEVLFSKAMNVVWTPSVVIDVSLDEIS